MLEKLLLYNNVGEDELVVLAVQLFGMAVIETGEYILTKENGRQIEELYYRIQRLLINKTAFNDNKGTVWEQHVCSLIAESENLFTQLADKGAIAVLESETARQMSNVSSCSPDEKIADFGFLHFSDGESLYADCQANADTGNRHQRSILSLVIREIKILKHIYRLDWNRLARAIGDEDSCIASLQVSLMLESHTGFSDQANLKALNSQGVTAADQTERRAGYLRRTEYKRKAIAEALRLTDDMESAAAIAAYHQHEGCGLFEKHDVFRWDGRITGVEKADTVEFDDLIGYELEKSAIIENVECFVNKAPGINMLLYGDRGTGKSSCIKASLNRYAHSKLRLLALPKEQIGALTEIMSILSCSSCRFIIFIDDLSFEDNETGYKSFKSALEGSVMPQPENIMVCVTSNRRSIVKELWRDREGQDDVHINDSLQEKRSLADRFGVAVSFSAPNKREYLRIVVELARKADIDLDEDKLIDEALKWEIKHFGRSGRTARQFINYMMRSKVISI